jgi:hypothetical protein
MFVISKIMQAAAVRLEWLNARRENEVGTVIVLDKASAKVVNL